MRKQLKNDKENCAISSTRNQEAYPRSLLLMLLPIRVLNNFLFLQEKKRKSSSVCSSTRDAVVGSGMARGVKRCVRHGRLRGGVFFGVDRVRANARTRRGEIARLFQSFRSDTGGHARRPCRFRAGPAGLIDSFL